MWSNYLWMGESPRMELLPVLYGQWDKACIRGRWTLIGVDYKLGSSSSMITGQISWSADLLAASSHDLGESLAPQAMLVLWDLDKVAWALPRSSRLQIRSPGPLAGRWGFWQVESSWQVPPGPYSVGTHGYRCLSSPDRRVGVAAETTSWRRKGRPGCMRIYKRKSSWALMKLNVKLLEHRSRSLKWRQGAVIVEEPLSWPELGKIIMPSRKVFMSTKGRSSGGMVGARFWYVDAM
jgi:hypothetical protein